MWEVSEIAASRRSRSDSRHSAAAESRCGHRRCDGGEAAVWVGSGSRQVLQVGPPPPVPSTDSDRSAAAGPQGPAAARLPATGTTRPAKLLPACRQLSVARRSVTLRAPPTAAPNGGQNEAGGGFRGGGDLGRPRRRVRYAGLVRVLRSSARDCGTAAEEPGPIHGCAGLAQSWTSSLRRLCAAGPVLEASCFPRGPWPRPGPLGVILPGRLGDSDRADSEGVPIVGLGRPQITVHSLV